MTNVDNMDIQETMRIHKICVIVPTFNNAGTLRRVLTDVLTYSAHVILVNDGSTDETSRILSEFDHTITIVSYHDNKGKGYALKIGFRKAIELGYEYAITIDSDGQHYPSDLWKFVQAVVEHPGALVVGQRDLTKVDINGKSSFANKFSNFWYAVQTGKNLKDTQTGYRAYPLKSLYGLNILTSRYEAELELLVFAAWNGVEIISIPIQVYYPPQAERVSHFKPALDFTRISILNTVLCVLAILYGLPSRFVNCIKRKKLFSKEFKPFTRKHGEKRPAAITLGRIVRSLYGLAHFIFWSIFVFKPYSYLYFHIGKESDAKKLRFHKSLQRISRFFAKYIPGSGTIYENPSNETFDKPALIICNHQSLLDLPVIMSVNPKLILLTNDWVWNNKFFGNIVHYADFLPVSAGMDVILPRLRVLKDKGYSIVVFPEGTRSNDCVIQRFHQGAFLLAQELKLDVVPMVLHGAGNYLAKSDFMFRKGKITLRILPRIAYNTYGDLLLRKQASAFRKVICNEFDAMIRNIETPEFFKSLVLYKYAYRGWKTVSTCKMLLKKMHEFEQQLCIENGNNSKTYFINSGIGVIPLLYALSHREIEVYGYEENIQNFKIACETPDLPKNLHFKHVVFNSDYNDLPADANLFIIDDGKGARKFNGRKTTVIHMEP